MTGGEVEVDTAGLRACGSRITSCGEGMREVIDAGNAAMGMGERAFGMLLFFVPGFFHNSQVRTIDAMRSYSEAISATGDAVGQCADSYDQRDDEVASTITSTGGGPL